MFKKMYIALFTAIFVMLTSTSSFAMIDSNFVMQTAPAVQVLIEEVDTTPQSEISTIVLKNSY